MRRIVFRFAFVLLFWGPVSATVIHVPSQYLTIQAGINASLNGDTVLAERGLYNEHLNFNGKRICVTSNFMLTSDTLDIMNTIIDGDSSGSVVTFNHGEDSTLVLIGFTIQHGYAIDGGGICADSSNATIIWCNIINNGAGSYGGGVYADSNSRITLDNCRLDSNYGLNGGATALIDNSSMNLMQCQISGNSPSESGLNYSIRSTLKLVKSTILNSQGIYVPSQPFPEYRTSIIIDSSYVRGMGISTDHASLSFDHSRLDSIDAGESNYASNFTFREDTLTNSYVRTSACQTIIKSVVKNSSFGIWGCDEGWGIIDSSSVSGHISQQESSTWNICNSVIFADCELRSTMCGGAMNLRKSTILGNCIDMSVGGKRLKIDSCIVFSNGGPIIRSDSIGRSIIEIHCSDLYGFNDNWLISTPLSLDTSNVIFRDPQFCDPSDSNYYLTNTSPCLPESTSCGLMGVYGMGCMAPRHLWHVATAGNDLKGNGSESYPFRTIQHGINRALNGDTILVSCGIYVENINLLGKSIIVSSTYLVSADTLDIANTTIDGDSAGPTVTINHGEDSTTTLLGFTIRGGSSDSSGERGGGVYCVRINNPLISHCIVTQNFNYGINMNEFGSLAIEGCIISNNRMGGVVAKATDPSDYGCNLAINSCKISGNQQYGIFCHGGLNLSNSVIADNAGTGITSRYYSIRDCIIINNLEGLQFGSDIYRRDIALDYDYSIHDCVIEGNNGYGVKLLESISYIYDSSISGNTGTGVIMTGDSYLRMDGCAVSNNGACGIRSSWGNSQFGMDLDSCIFENNVSEFGQGGAIFMSGGVNSIRNCLFKGNSAHSGGALWLYRDFEIANCTFVGNSADTGAAIAYRYWGGHTLSIFNSILAYNLEGPPISCEEHNGEPFPLSCTDIYGNAGGDWVGCIDYLADSLGNFSLDPRLCEDSSYLASNSPCLPENNSCAQLIGALGEGCGPIGTCNYLSGDINGNHSVNGIDVVFAVNYFKGGPHPPVQCDMCSEPLPFYAALDVNGNCATNGIDITFFVRYLKGQVPSLLYCPDCPPASMAPPVPAVQPIRVPVLKSGPGNKSSRTE